MIMQLEYNNIHAKNKYLQKQTKALRQLSPVQHNKSQKRVGYLKLALVLVVIVILFNSKHYVDEKLSHNFSSAIGQNTSIEATNSALELQRIYELMRNDQQWTNKRISLFVYHWESLDRNKQKQLKLRPWFQQFSVLLGNEIESQIINKGNQETQDLDLVKTLAIVIGRKDLANEFNDQNEQESTSVTDIKANEIPLIDSEVAAEEPIENIDFAQDSPDQQTDEVLAVVTQELNLEVAPEINPIIVQSKEEEIQFSIEPDSQIIFLEDVNALVKHYKKAYQIGNTRNILKLFADNRRKFTQLKDTYKTIFKSSKKRRIEINNLNWEFSDNRAIGTGRYKAIHELVNNKGTQTITAKVKLNFQIKDEQLRIINLSLLDPHVKFDRAAKSKRSKKKTKTRTKPTMAELFDIVNRYTAAYEEGSIRTLLSLFSTDIRTNTRTNITGAQEDYAKLFDETTDRQMFIRDINWSIEDNYARGVGRIETVIIPNDGRQAYSTSGTIQIMAKKIGNKLLITNLYEN